MANVRKGNFKVFLIQGKYLGVYTWHYLRVDRLKLPLYRKAMKSNAIDVSQYGDILASGWGEEPPNDVCKQMDSLYGQA